MSNLHRSLSRVSQTTRVTHSPFQPAPLLARQSLPPNYTSTTYRTTHSQARVRPNKRPSPYRIARPNVPVTNTMAHNAAPYTTNANGPSSEPVIHHEFEPVTGTWQYIVADPSSGRAAIIDPVLDYEPASQLITTTTADLLLSLVKEKRYTVDWILETHAHADHLTAASYIQKRLTEEQGGHKPLIAIGARINKVQKMFAERYGVPEKEYKTVFDKLFADDETFSIGGLEASTTHLPGHTPDHLGYKIGDNVFCGDSIFHPDIGTARCDFPGGSAQNLWASTRKLLSFPDHVKIWTGHDYPPAARGDPVPYTTVKEHKKLNKHLQDGITEDKFLTMRTERDGMLGAPRLIHPSLQMNIRAGRLPEATEAGQRLLHLPLKLSGAEW